MSLDKSLAKGPGLTRVDSTIPKEVKIAYVSFIENREVLSWNIVISSKIKKEKSGRFHCRNCEFSHETQHFVIDHIEMNHLPNFPGYRCTLCKLLFQTWFIFKNHVNKIHCSNISIKTVKSSSTANQPMLANLNNTQKLQNQPGKVVSILKRSQESINFSVQKKHLPGEKLTYQCKFCVFTDGDIDVVKTHCEESHSSSKVLFTNELADKEVYTCDTCNILCPNQTNYIEHKRRAHKQIVKPYKCDLCDYRCLRRARLISHLAAKHHLHSNQRRTRRNKERSGKADLKAGEQRFFKCTKCEYLARTNDDLRVHDYKHHFIAASGGGVKQEPIAEVQGVSQGPKVHCRYCLRSCTSQEALTDHEMTHGGVHAYNCELCNKGFRQRIRWIQHMDRYHQVKIQASPVKRGIYTCQYCERDFPYKKTVNEHMISEHGFTRDSTLLLPEQFKIENVVTSEIPTVPAPAVAVSEESLDETSDSLDISDNFVEMDTESQSSDLVEDISLTDDLEASLAENIVDYGIFAPDPLTVDFTVKEEEEEDLETTKEEQEEVETSEILQEDGDNLIKTNLYLENKFLNDFNYENYFAQMSSSTV